MSVVIIVGGPPNSGKSTFAESLARALEDLGTTAVAVDLDLYAPTLEFIRGKISKEERDKKKRAEITPEDIEDAARRLKQVAKDHEFVIGDAPGGISKDLRPIFQEATHGIILCREDKQSEIDQWKAFFSEMKVSLVAVIISRTTGTEGIRGNDLIEGALVGLNRTPIDSPAIKALASILRSRFDL